MEMVPMSKSTLSDNAKRHLYSYIQEMNTKQKTKLPSENQIAQQLGVSRVTIRRTLDELEQEGVIFRIHGRGTFINPVALQVKITINPGMEFSTMIRESGYKSRFEITRFEVTSANEKVATELQIAKDSPIYVIEKVYYADDHPAIVSIDWFPYELLKEPIRREDSEKDSTFDILKHKAGCIVTRDKIEIESMSLKRMERFSIVAKCMECDSVLTFHGVNYDQDNHPVIYDTEFYNTNFIQFNMLRIKRVF